MELLLVLIAIFLVLIYTYFTKKRYIKNKIKNSWKKLPEKKIVDLLDEKILEKSMDILKKHYPCDFFVDKYTWQDLDFFKIFARMNKGYSSVGEEYLYYRLRNYDFSQRSLDDFQSLKDFFQKEETIRQNIEERLYYIGKNKNFSLLSYVDKSLKIKLTKNFKIYILGLLPLVLLILSIVLFNIHTKIAIYIFVGFFVASMSNLIYYKYKSKYILDDIKNSSYLGNFIKISKKISKINLPNKSNINENLNSLGKISFWLNFVEAEDIEDPFLIMIEEIKKIFLLPLISYDKVNKLVKNKHMKVLKLFMEIGKLEASISSLNYELVLSNTQKPIFVDEYKIEALNIYHPLIKNPVGNKLLFDKVNIVTGSNASGKSTYVKSIAINAILAMSLNFVYAQDFKIKKAGVFTSMAIRDDVVSGDSYFIAEIKSLKRIVDDAKDKKSYYFVDEILKGTNTIERIAASFAIINYLIEKNSLAMIASHDIELTRMFGNDVKNIHFRESIKEDGDIDFDYKLKIGPSKTKNAIRLLGKMGFSKEIVDLSNMRAEVLSKEKNI